MSRTHPGRTNERKNAKILRPRETYRRPSRRRQLFNLSILSLLFTPILFFIFSTNDVIQSSIKNRWCARALRLLFAFRIPPADELRSATRSFAAVAAFLFLSLGAVFPLIPSFFPGSKPRYELAGKKNGKRTAPARYRRN